MKVKGMCRNHGVSDATFCNWKAKYGGVETAGLKRERDRERTEGTQMDVRPSCLREPSAE